MSEHEIRYSTDGPQKRTFKERRFKDRANSPWQNIMRSVQIGEVYEDGDVRRGIRECNPNFRQDTYIMPVSTQEIAYCRSKEALEALAVLKSLHG